MKKNLNERILQPVHPNVGIEMDYRRRLRKLIDAMYKSTTYWVEAAYRNNSPEIATDAREPSQTDTPVLGPRPTPGNFTTVKIVSKRPWQGAMDATPAAKLEKVVKRLTKIWQGRFDEAADDLAEFFSKDISKRSDKALMGILKKSGMTVKFKMTKAQRDIVQATVQQNVALIKSIPSHYMTQVQGSIMRAVQTGRDLGQLSKDLQKHYGVSYRRAAIIARDQTNKATAALTRARQIELGIEEAIWLHSHAGKKPRPTHVKMDGKRYDIKKGMYDPAERRHIHPGELINCRCVSKSIIEGFS